MSNSSYHKHHAIDYVEFSVADMAEADPSGNELAVWSLAPAA